MSKLKEMISASKSNLNKMEKVRNEHPIFEKGILHVMAVEQEKLEIFQEIQAEQEEQNKPVEVPQFVADEIRDQRFGTGSCKQSNGSLLRNVFHDLHSSATISNGGKRWTGGEFYEWLKRGDSDNVELFVKAVIFGYTVKQEPKYQILKLHVDYFDAVAKGIKTFEIRKNDRNFQIGNILVLREYDPIDSRIGGFTGRECRVRVTCMTDYEQKSGYVVLGIVLVKEGTE